MLQIFRRNTHTRILNPTLNPYIVRSNLGTNDNMPLRGKFLGIPY